DQGGASELRTSSDSECQSSDSSRPYRVDARVHVEVLEVASDVPARNRRPMSRLSLILLGCFAAMILFTENPALAQQGVFDRDNLAAWCIVPFDAKKRGPEERAAMLEKLGFKKFVYDYRAEHIPQWDEELSSLKKHHIELLGWWFPTSLNDEAKKT